MKVSKLPDGIISDSSLIPIVEIQQNGSKVTKKVTFAALKNYLPSNNNNGNSNNVGASLVARCVGVRTSIDISEIIIEGVNPQSTMLSQATTYEGNQNKDSICNYFSTINVLETFNTNIHFDGLTVISPVFKMKYKVITKVIIGQDPELVINEQVFSRIFDKTGTVAQTVAHEYSINVNGCFPLRGAIGCQVVTEVVVLGLYSENGAQTNPLNINILSLSFEQNNDMKNLLNIYDDVTGVNEQPQV